MNETGNNGAESSQSIQNSWEDVMKNVQFSGFRENHSEAVEDIDKARKMAEAENPYREQAAAERQKAAKNREYMGRLTARPDLSSEQATFASIHTGRANDLEARAVAAAEKAGREYDDPQDYKNIYPDAVEDVSKALEMAQAEQPARRQESLWRNESERLFKKAANATGEEAERLHERAEEDAMRADYFNDQAEEAAKQAAQEYDNSQATPNAA